MTRPAINETDQLITDCETRDDKLSEWEQGFIQSVREQFDRRGSLSDKQLEILNNIWEKVT
jgi:regulator of sigma D